MNTTNPEIAMTDAARAKRSSRQTEIPTVRDRLMDASRNFSNSELKVVRELLTNYPAAGLTTVSRLAQLAGVSDPTVLRLAMKLGFVGHSGLQAALLAEVEIHMRSPLTLSSGGQVKGKYANVYQEFYATMIAQLEATARETATADFERAASLLAQPKAQIICMGGRFSRFLAGLIQRCLHHLRDGSMFLDGNAADLVDEIAMIGNRHVLVVFDYRRYQANVVSFAEQAKQRGASILLFTDRWKSPIADFADVTLTVSTESSSPFDTMSTALAQVEALIAGLTVRLGDGWRERMEQLEKVRSQNHVTIERRRRPALNVARSADKGKKP